MTLEKHHLDNEGQSAMMLQSRKCERRFPWSLEKASVCATSVPVLVTTRVFFSDTEHTLPIKASRSSHYEVSILQNRSIQGTCGQESKCFKERWVTADKQCSHSLFFAKPHFLEEDFKLLVLKEDFKLFVLKEDFKPHFHYTWGLEVVFFSSLLSII